MKSFYLLLTAFCFSLSATAQSSINNAWEVFLKNNTKESRALFTAASAKNETSSEALLSLALMAASDQSGEKAFDYFSQYFASSKNPEAYLHALWTDYFFIYNGYTKSAKHLSFYNALLQRKDMDGTIAALAHSAIGKHYEQGKKYDLAQKSFQKIGAINEWMITGEFENISTSGFDKNYEVLDKPEATAVFTGKKNAKFGWRTVPYLRHDRWFDFQYYSDYSDAIVFAQSFIQAPEEITAQLRVGVSGSVKVWVNDQLLISEVDERNNDLDSYISTLKLHKGYNRVLVQIGESYAGRSNFLLRLTDDKGVPLTGLAAVKTPQPYEKEKTFKAERVTLPWINFLADELQKDPSSYLNQILLAKMYLRNDNTFEARQILEPLKNKFPESTFINSLYLEIFRKDDNRTGLDTVREAIKVSDPESALGLELLYYEYIAQEDYTNAETVLKKIEAIWGETSAVYEKKIQLASYLKNYEELVALAEKAYALFPNVSYNAWMKYLVEKEVKKSKQAASYLKKYLESNDDFELAKKLANDYFDAGDSNAGLNVYLQEIKNDPIAVGIYIGLADQYYRLQQYDKAEKTYLQAIEIAPGISSYFSSLGKVYEMSKKNDAALKAYERSLELNPNNYQALQSLRKIQGKKEVFDYFEQPDVRALIAKAPKLADFPDEHAIILEDQVQRVVYEHGGSEEKHYYITKILTQKGLESFKEYNISYHNSQNLNVEIAEVIKANGTKVPAEQNENQIIFTNLEVGDVINLRYKLQNFNTGSLASHFWDTFYFTHGMNYVNAKYALLIHRNKPFQHVFSLKDIPAVKSAKDEFDLYEWKAQNQEALVYEDKMPPMADVANALHLSTIPDWKFVAGWYNNIATAKARSSFEIKEVIEELFKGKQNLKALDKVRLIYNYITQNIAYSSVSFRQSGIVPQKPATVINTRIGDCKDVSTLFVTMCKEAGIEAELVLVKTSDYGKKAMLLPSIDFNHCIAKAKVDGKSYMVELTSGTLPFITFDNASLDATVLEINNETTSIAELRPQERVLNSLYYKTQVDINNLDMKIKEDSYVTGSAASSYRNAFNHISNKDQIKKLKEGIAQQYPECEVSSLQFVNLNPADAVSDTVKSVTEYALNNIGKMVGGMKIFTLPWSMSAKATQLQIVQPRNFGVNLNELFYAESSLEEMTLVMPASTKIVEPFKPLSISNEYIDFHLSAVQQGNKLLLKRSFSLKKGFVPAEKAEEFKQIFARVVEADQQQIAYK